MNASTLVWFAIVQWNVSGGACHDVLSPNTTVYLGLKRLGTGLFASCLHGFIRTRFKWWQLSMTFSQSFLSTSSAAA